MEDRIESPADLREGDLFIGPIGGLAGVGAALGMLLLGEAFRVGSFSARHMGMVTRAHMPALTMEWDNAVRHEQPALISQAMPGGSETVPFDPAKHWTEKCAWVRLPEDYPGQAKDAAAIARLMVAEKVGYSFLSYPSLGLYRLGVRQEGLLKYINRRRPVSQAIRREGPWPGQLFTAELPVEAICSVFVDQAWTLAGKKVMEGVRPQAVTPGALAGELWSFPGASWCLPRGEDRTPRTWHV